MASWWPISISDHLNKRICRFLLHRYLGHFLKEKFTLDQLSIRFLEGTGSVSDVDLDTEVINEGLEAASIPVRMVDGFIGNVRVKIPWSNIMTESCSVEISNLEVTLEAHPMETLDTVGSMFVSMMGSMTSMQLAQSLVEEETQTSQDDSSAKNQLDGIEACAQMIDSVLCRTKVTLSNVIVRIEHCAPDSKLATAVELHIEHIEFCDEVIDADSTVQPSGQPVTTQPHSVYTISDMNKIVHLHGIQLFTDVFSRPGTCSTMLTSTIRRRKQSDSDGKVFSRDTACDESQFASRPVLFAVMSRERHTLRLKLKGCETGADGPCKQVELDAYFGTMQIFLTPSQVYLLSDILQAVFADGTHSQQVALSAQRHMQGNPMEGADYNHIEAELLRAAQQGVDIWRTDLTSGNWSGEEQFYSVAATHPRGKSLIPAPSNPDLGTFTSVCISSDGSQNGAQNGSSPDLLKSVKHRRGLTAVASASKDAPETTRCKVRFGNIFLCLSHNDPMSNETVNFSAACDEVAAWGKTFFELLVFSDRNDKGDPDVRFRVCGNSVEGYKFTVQLGRCRTELDISMADRLYNLLFCQPVFRSPSVAFSAALLHDNFLDFSTKQQRKLSMCAEVVIKDLTVDVSFPVPDLSATDRYPWWMKCVRDEVLRLHIKDAKATCADLKSQANSTTFALHFKSVTGWFLENRQDVGIKFLYGCAPRSSGCRLEATWTAAKHASLSDSPHGALQGSLSPSSLDAFTKLSSADPGPFNKNRTLHENDELTIIGNKKELMEFGKSCAQKAQVYVNISLPIVKLYLPHKNFYETLYNRLVNDLTMWTPASPNFLQRTVAMRQQQQVTGANYYSVHVAGLNTQSSMIASDQFALCRGPKATDSDSDSDTNSVDERTIDAQKRRQQHKFVLQLSCDRGTILLNTLQQGSTDSDASLNRIRFGVDHCELCTVAAFEGDPSLSYIYFRTQSGNVFHANAPPDLLSHTQPELVDVESSRFGEMTDLRCMAEPTPSSLVLNQVVNDDNFAVAIRAALDPDGGQKTCLIAVGVRNTTVHHCFAHDWIQELVGFFDVVDYPVKGYQPPPLVNELHVHGWHCAVQYKPADAAVAARCYVDSFDVASNLVYGSATTRLYFILEELSLFVAKCRTNELASVSLAKNFVCVLSQGLFQLEVTLDDKRSPNFEIKAMNDLLEVRTCADSAAVLVQLITCLANEAAEFGAVAEPSSSATRTQHSTRRQRDGQTSLPDHARSPAPSGPPSFTPSMEQKITSLIDCAMQELPIVASPPKSSSSSGEYCIVDVVNMPGPTKDVVNVLSAEPIEILDDHFVKPPITKDDPLTHLPDGYKMPEARYLVRDFSVVWYLYGGQDFGELPCDKSYSRAGIAAPQIRQRFTEAKKSLLTAGGLGRDHSVVVELALHKIGILHDVFPPEHCPSSRQTLLVHNIEIRDRLSASNINKFLYQFNSEELPRPDGSSMVAVRLVQGLERADANSPLTECSLKISLLPIRVNVDQDTLEFLQDYGESLSALALEVVQSVTAKSSSRSNHDYPVTRLGSRLSPSQHVSGQANDAPGVQRRLGDEDDLLASTPLGDPLSSFAIPHQQEHEEGGDAEPVSASLNLIQFADEDHFGPVEPNSAAFDLDDRLLWTLGEATSEAQHIDLWDHGTEPSFSPPPPVRADDITASVPGENLLGAAEVAVDEQQARRNDKGQKPLYFTSFSFSPDLLIKLDYNGKGVNMTKGAVQGLLRGLSQLHQTELRLKEINSQQGHRGANKLVTFALNEWLKDIKRNQLTSILQGVAPMHCLVELAQGLRDLVWIPVEEYRTQGRLVHGLQRGAHSFTVSTAAATIELAQRVTGAVQAIAEFTYDVVNPNYPPQPIGNWRGLQQPATVVEGVAMACQTVRQGLSEVGNTVQLAGQEERAQGRWAWRGVLRHAVPSAIKPVAVLSQATGQILGGARNQLKPGTRREEMEKWRAE